MIIYDDHTWWLYMMIIYDHFIWSSYMIIIYDHHIWSSYMIIIYDDHIWWSYMIIMYDDYIWWSYMMIIFERPRPRPQPFCCSWRSTFFVKILHFWGKKLIFRVCLKCNFKAVCKKSLKTYQKYYRETKWMSPSNFCWKNDIYSLYKHYKSFIEVLFRESFYPVVNGTCSWSSQEIHKRLWLWLNPSLKLGWGNPSIGI